MSDPKYQIDMSMLGPFNPIKDDLRGGIRGLTELEAELGYGPGTFYIEDDGWSFVPDKKFNLIVEKPRVHGIIRVEDGKETL